MTEANSAAVPVWTARAIVEQMDSTTVIPPNTWFEVDIHGNLIVNALATGKEATRREN